MDKHTTVIKGGKSSFNLNLKELFQYRDLISLFVKRNFILIYKQTILGPLWLIINPLFTSVIFTFVFGNFAGISTDGVPQFLFYLSGNTIWGLFNAAVLGTSNTFVSNSSIFGKIYFPRLTVPISQTITALVNFLIQFAMFILFWIYYYFAEGGLSVSLNLLLVPVLLLQACLLALGVGIVASSLTTKYRDLTLAVGFGMQLWMYVTPIVYPLSATGGLMKTILLLNPVTPIVHNFRYAVLNVGELLIMPWILSMIVTIVTLCIGIIMFNKIEKTFMDTV